MRKVHIGKKVWQYNIGNSHTNIISPNGKRTNVWSNTINGMSPEVFEAEQREGVSIWDGDSSSNQSLHCS